MPRKTKRQAPPKERNPMQAAARFRSNAGAHGKTQKAQRAADKRQLRAQSRELPRLVA